MFERFSQDARLAVIDAQRHARDTGCFEIAAEHLALALLERDDDTGRYLADRVDGTESLAARFRDVRQRAGITPTDARALGELGIDIDRVVDAVERAHGENVLASGTRRGRFTWPWRRKIRRRPEGHIPFTSEAKRVLTQALQEAIALKERRIGSEHLLFALLTLPSGTRDVLADSGIDYLDARRALRGSRGLATGS